MTNAWTQKRREALAIRNQVNKPWLFSTGPKTVEGKRKVAMNGYRGAVRPTLRAVAKALRSQQAYLDRC